MNSRCVMMRMRTSRPDSARSTWGAPGIGFRLRNRLRWVTANLCSAP